MIPFQITFLDFPESDKIWIAIQNRIEKLEKYFDGIIRCEAIISCPHRHRHGDRLYHIQVHIFIPGDDIIVNRNPVKNEAHRDVNVAIRDTFDAAERLLKEKVRMMRQKIKHHEKTHEGKIAKIFYDDGYGFLVSNDGREFYFSEHSILNQDFSNLKPGQKVKFTDELGEKGPQVTSMSIV